MADQTNDVILLMKRNVPRSWNLISMDLYKRNKAWYEEKGYIEADDENVKAYFKRRGITLSPPEPEKKTKKTKDIDTVESSGE